MSAERALPVLGSLEIIWLVSHIMIIVNNLKQTLELKLSISQTLKVDNEAISCLFHILRCVSIIAKEGKELTDILNETSKPPVNKTHFPI